MLLMECSKNVTITNVILALLVYIYIILRVIGMNCTRGGARENTMTLRHLKTPPFRITALRSHFE